MNSYTNKFISKYKRVTAGFPDVNSKFQFMLLDGSRGLHTAYVLTICILASCGG
jgi:hypothetical protein